MKNNSFKIKPILLIIFFALLWVTLNKSGLIYWHSLYTEKELLTQQIERLKNEEINIKNHLEKLNNDLDYIQFIAYSKFKMVKPGEKIYRIKDYKTVK